MNILQKLYGHITIDMIKLFIAHKVKNEQKYNYSMLDDFYIL